MKGCKREYTLDYSQHTCNVLKCSKSFVSLCIIALILLVCRECECNYYIRPAELLEDSYWHWTSLLTVLYMLLEPKWLTWSHEVFPGVYVLLMWALGKGECALALVGPSCVDKGTCCVSGWDDETVTCLAAFCWLLLGIFLFFFLSNSYSSQQESLLLSFWITFATVLTLKTVIG